MIDKFGRSELGKYFYDPYSTSGVTGDLYSSSATTGDLYIRTDGNSTIISLVEVSSLQTLI